MCDYSPPHILVDATSERDQTTQVFFSIWRLLQCIISKFWIKKTQLRSRIFSKRVNLLFRWQENYQKNVFALFFGANFKSFRCVTLRSCTIQSSAKAVMISPFSLVGPLKGHVLLLMLSVRPRRRRQKIESRN